VGAAVFDHTGHVIGGVSAATLTLEAAGSDGAVGPDVVKAAAEVSRALGANTSA
jgi:DNA-binding IclR family transcriptional regulator